MTLPAQVKASEDRANAAIAEMQSKPAEEPQVEAPAPSAPENWETKYKVLQGKYNAEVPRLTAKVRELTAEIDVLKAHVETKKAAPVTDTDESLFDPDLINVIRSEAAKAARSEFDPFRPAIEGQRAKAEAEAQIATEQERQDRFLAALSSVHPDWEKVDGSPDFKRYLIGTDARTGKVRQQMLEDSLRSFDPTDAILIFSEFKRAVSSSPRGMEAQLTPAMSGPGASVTDGSAKVWTRAEVAKFYSDVTKGHYAKDPQRAAQIEADITKAQQEGRIRG